MAMVIQIEIRKVGRCIGETTEPLLCTCQLSTGCARTVMLLKLLSHIPKLSSRCCEAPKASAKPCKEFGLPLGISGEGLLRKPRLPEHA